MPPISKKQQIRGTRILLTVFNGFLLSSILFRSIIHGIVEMVRRPSNPYAISMILIGIVVLVSLGLATYATWFDNAIILLVSGIVLICVFILTLVFGILRIVKSTPLPAAKRLPGSATIASYGQDGVEQSPVTEKYSHDEIMIISDKYALAEDVAKLAIELIFILFAILGTFVLYHYVKSKYAAVPTNETKPT